MYQFLLVINICLVRVINKQFLVIILYTVNGYFFKQTVFYLLLFLVSHQRMEVYPNVILRKIVLFCIVYINNNIYAL